MALHLRLFNMSMHILLLAICFKTPVAQASFGRDALKMYEKHSVAVVIIFMSAALLWLGLLIFCAIWSYKCHQRREEKKWQREEAAAQYTE